MFSVPTNKKRPGPRPAIPAAKVDRMLREQHIKSANDATALAMTLMLTVLLDKYGAEDYIQDIYNDWNKLAEESLEGRVKLHELRTVLREEYKINI